MRTHMIQTSEARARAARMRTYEHDARVAEHNDRIARALARPAGCVAPARVGAGMGAVRPRLRTMTRLVSAAILATPRRPVVAPL